MRFSRAAGFLFALVMFIAVGIVTPSVLMRIETSRYMYTNVADLPQAETGLVLGASVVRDKLSPALAARTDEAAELFKSEKVTKLLVTGAVEPGYDEVTPMKKSLEVGGVPGKAVITDSQGYDTYTSVYRAKNDFHTQSFIIVSQDFHLPRAIFIARTLHIDAYGLVAPRGGRLFYYLREIPASWKALWDLLTNRNPDSGAILVPLTDISVYL
jgi:SanA protein